MVYVKLKKLNTPRRRTQFYTETEITPEEFNRMVGGGIELYWFEWGREDALVRTVPKRAKKRAVYPILVVVNGRVYWDMLKGFIDYEKDIAYVDEDEFYNLFQKWHI